jgi:hypothetical protein
VNAFVPESEVLGLNFELGFGGVALVNDFGLEGRYQLLNRRTTDEPVNR